MARMRSPGRFKLQLLLGLVVFAGLCVMLPRFLFVVELGLRELRYFGWLLVLVAAAIWLLVKLGRRG